MKDNCPHIPKVRFPGFKNPWQQFKVGDFIDFYPTNTLSWEQLQYGINGIKNIHYGLIHTYLPTLVDIRKCTLPSILQNQLPHKYKLCKKGDIVLTDASEDIDGIAKCVELINLGGQNIICGLHTIHGRDNKHITSVGFKGYLFNAEIFRSQIRKSTQGIKVFSISNKTIAAFNISIPCTQEQMKIVKCLASIDKQIEQQRKELEALKQHKQALMQQLFPHIGNNKPRVRVVRSNQKWKVLHTEEVFIRVTERNNGQSDNVLTVSAQFGLIKQQDFFDRTISNDIKDYYLIKKGDFTYNKSYSSQYPMGVIKPLKNYEDGVVSPLYICFRVKDGFVHDFFEHYFESGHFNYEIRKIAQEGARNHGLLNVSVKDFFTKTKLLVPSLVEEQETIAKTLSSINTIIEASEKKYELLKNHKRGLMQQLFPD